MEQITSRQLKKMAKIFKLSGKTFQQAAIEAGLQHIPDHVYELNRDAARQFLKHFSYYLVVGKEKQ